MAGLGGMPMPSIKCLQFRHDCQHLGCSNPSCPQCALCQRRRCVGNFAPKYLAPCDVLEAKCGAQIYVVIVDTATGQLVQSGTDDAFLRLSLVDGRKLAAEGEWEEALDRCQLLVNKAGQPLLAHGRSGAYSEENAVMVPIISGQAMLPDLKVTDSSEALLAGRAPPFRLLARVVQRGGLPMPGVAPVLSEPFVVATARVKGAAKAEIPHIDDHVGKLEGLGVQTQKKLEDIGAAAAAAGVPNLAIPLNCVTKVGQFRELVEIAERSKPLRETLKQVLRLTKGWDVARDHSRRAVHTDAQLRVFHPDGRTDVGLVYRCGAFNVVDINQPVGLLRRRRAEQRLDQELVDVIWLEADVSAWPDAVRRIVPRAAAAWWHEGHPGWAFLPLTVSHIPAYAPTGKPLTQMSSYSFTLKTSPPVSGGVLAGGGAGAGGQAAQQMGGPPSGGMVPMGLPGGGADLAGLGLAGLQAPGSGAAPPQQQQQQQQQNGGRGALPPELLASMGMGAAPGSGGFLPFGGAGALEGLGLAGRAGAGGDPASGSTPFEDPAFQQLMQMVAANNQAGGSAAAAAAAAAAPLDAAAKRKADASLDTWIAMQKSLDLSDLDLPAALGMAGLGSGPPAPGSGQMASAPPSAGTGPRTVVGPVLPVASGGPASSMDTGLGGGGGGGGGGPSASLAAAAAAAAAGAAPGSSVPFAEFLTTMQQQRAQQRAAEEARSAEADPRSGSVGGSGVKHPRAPAPPPGCGDAAPQSTDSALAPAPASDAAARGAPDSAPARIPPGVTMGQLRDMFARAVRQEISFQEVEGFLATHGLVEGGGGDGGGGGGGDGGGGAAHGGRAASPAPMDTATASAGAEPATREGTAAAGAEPGVATDAASPAQEGLDDMRSMEDDLPTYAK